MGKILEQSEKMILSSIFVCQTSEGSVLDHIKEKSMLSTDEIKPFYENQKEFEIILDNAERYVEQAEIFLGDGLDENAILSIGYADGLVDALRLAKGLDFKM